MIHPKITLNLCVSLLVLENPVVMAVININTDSFYEKSRFTERGGILKQAETHLREGATFLDIGGMSSRPGAPISNAKEEVEKIVPVIKSLKKEFPDAFISIDTVHSAVASAAYQEGAVLVNDISAGAIDPDMFPFLAKTNIPYVLMHLKGVPRNIIIDPGFGFGKDVVQNYELLQNLSIFKILECPLMVGLSRKSMIYKVIDGTPEDALHGTTALHFFALQQGALILRAHDVKPAIDTIRVWKALENAKTN